MTIQEIYKKYNVMPQLQEHMLRVAGVGKIICDEINKNAENKVDVEGVIRKLVDTESVVTACLLHDMGNIIKFDLTMYPEFTNDKGLEYWQGVKNEYIKKYGNNEHAATDKIVAEIFSSKSDKVGFAKVKSLLSLTGFSKVLEVLERHSLEQKICNYADMRVGPFGILSVEERVNDGKERASRKTSVTRNSLSDFEKVVEGLKKLEDQIFAKSSIFPSTISDQTTDLEIDSLKNWEI